MIYRTEYIILYSTEKLVYRTEQNLYIERNKTNKQNGTKLIYRMGKTGRSGLLTFIPVWRLNMKKVITYGTFDLLHVGHINLLRRAKELGDYLIVVVSSDEFNAIKGKKAYYSFEDRKKILEAIKYVDEVLPEYTWEQKIDDVVKNNVDVFVMGDDWAGKFDFLKEYCEVVYLPRTEGISTSKIKEDLGIAGSKEE